jgi:hypothetical protein
VLAGHSSSGQLARSDTGAETEHDPHVEIYVEFEREGVSISGTAIGSKSGDALETTDLNCLIRIIDVSAIIQGLEDRKCIEESVHFVAGSSQMTYGALHPRLIRVNEFKRYSDTTVPVQEGEGDCLNRRDDRGLGRRASAQPRLWGTPVESDSGRNLIK